MLHKEWGNQAFIHRYHAEEDADRGSDQRRYLVSRDRLETGSLERYSGLQDFRLKQEG